MEKILSLLSQHPEWLAGDGRIDFLSAKRFLDGGGSPESAASRIWAFVMADGHADVTDKVWWTFGGGVDDFYAINTAQALGLAAPDPVEEKAPPARTAEDAVRLLKFGWHYTGDARFLDLTKQEGRAEYVRRDAFAKNVPLEWGETDPALYRYFVLTNRVPSQPSYFGVRQSENPRVWAGFTLQNFLDNEWASRDGLPKPWKRGGARA
jgi:hypothetical protein